MQALGLLERLLTYEPSERASPREALRCRWFTDIAADDTPLLLPPGHAEAAGWPHSFEGCGLSDVVKPWIQTALMKYERDDKCSSLEDDGDDDDDDDNSLYRPSDLDLDV